jgi:DNA-binding transcriptional regulator GbsR (MarR family)
MGQGEIIKCLKKHKLLKTEEIVEELGISFGAVWKALKRMENIDVEVVPIKNIRNKKTFAWKLVGVKLYKNKLKELENGCR